MTTKMPILNITDGVTTVNLIDRRHIMLRDWRPAIVPDRDTEIEPATADGGRLVYTNFGNATEALTLAIADCDSDDSIARLQDLQRLLRSAKSYWTSGHKTALPVYLEARSTGETNTRYAVIYNFSLSGLPRPYGFGRAGDFLDARGQTVMPELELAVVRGHWLSNPPGEATAVPISATNEYNLVVYGNVDDDQNEQKVTDGTAFVASRQNLANLTHIYQWDDDAAAGTLVSIPASLPVTLFTGDDVDSYVAFGIDTTVDDSGPFGVIVFDITQRAMATTSYTIAWEYWSGAWTALDEVTDTTDSFGIEGPGSVSFWQADDWIPADPGSFGVVGYWVRARLSALTGTFTSPIIGNRQPYAVTWPYIDIDGEDVGGDIPALIRMKLKGRSYEGVDESGVLDEPEIGRVIIGLRSLDRGEQFRAYLNISDEQNTDCIKVSLGSNTTFSENAASPTGRVATYNPTVSPDAVATRATVSILPASVDDYIGVYRLFLRFSTTASAYFDIRVTVGLFGVTYYTSETIRVIEDVSSFNPKVMDFGKLILGGRELLTDADLFSENDLSINIQAGLPTGGSAAWDLRLYDVILIPTDEWAGDFSMRGQHEVDDPIKVNHYLDVDGIVNPRRPVRALLRTSSDDAGGSWVSSVSGVPILNSNKNQRLWFLTTSGYNGGVEEFSSWRSTLSAELFKTQRYLAFRGGR